MKKRIGFLSRGELGYIVLKGLLERPDCEVPFIITCDHSPEVGCSATHFEKLAKENNIPFYYTNQINKPDWIDFFSKFELDLVMAMLWVNTISEDIIASAKIGFINLHGGMLPQYRGNACANWAILNEEKYHGITVHLMNGGMLDDGPIVLQEKFPIKETTMIKELMDLNTSEGARMVLRSIDLIFNNKIELCNQDESKALYCYPRIPSDGEINWQMPASAIDRLIRAAGVPYPGAYSFFSDVLDAKKIKKLVIHKAHIESSTVEFCAVEGHLLRLDFGKKWGVVCGDKKLLVLDEVSIGSKQGGPSLFFRSVRQRMGIDTQTLLKVISKEIEIYKEGV